MAAAPAEPRGPRPRRRLLWSVYFVGVAQLAVAALAIFVVQRLLEKAPWQFEPARQKALLDGFAEFYDTPAALERALTKLTDVDLSFYRRDGQRVASTEPGLDPLSPGDVERLAKTSMIFLPWHGPLPITAVPVIRGGVMVGYGLVHYRPPRMLGPPPGEARLAPLDEHRPPPHDRAPPPGPPLDGPDVDGTPPPPPPNDEPPPMNGMHGAPPPPMNGMHGAPPPPMNGMHGTPPLGMNGMHGASPPPMNGMHDGPPTTTMHSHGARMHGSSRATPVWPSPSRLPIAIAAALLGAAVISFLFARSLARPLARMAEAAQAFGSGDLTARAGLRRNDELGDVARTFDQMAERVNALLRAQREFLANVSHELRTPLARIRVALDIAAEGDMESARQSLREIAEDWGDLDRLVEDVLAVARFDLGEQSPAAMTLRYEVLDARQLAERAAAAVRAMHPQHTFELALPDAAVELVGDGAMLRRVLDNLLVNAAKYSDPGSPVQLTVARLGHEVAFAVSDRGIGIEAADLPRLFEPFFRTDRSRARKTGGVGLGLALAKRIVEAHGGRIQVESQVGAGTTVTFVVPHEPPGAASLVA